MLLNMISFEALIKNGVVQGYNRSYPINSKRKVSPLPLIPEEKYGGCALPFISKVRLFAMLDVAIVESSSEIERIPHKSLVTYASGISLDKAIPGISPCRKIELPVSNRRILFSSRWIPRSKTPKGPPGAVPPRICDVITTFP